MYEVKGLPWRNGIGTDVRECKTSSEVIKKAGLDWQVNKCQLVAKIPFSINGNNEVDPNSSTEFIHDGSMYKECYEAYATYRTDINEPLGVVKKKYEVVQNVDTFNFFDDVVGTGNAMWDRAGYFGLGYKTFVTAKLPVTLDVGKDPVDHYLVFGNSHDGSSSVNILFTPVRVICTNMLNSAIRDADSYIRIKHTEKVRERLQKGAEILKIACQYAQDANQIYNVLYNTRFDDDEAMNYFAQMVLNQNEYFRILQYDKKFGMTRLAKRDPTILDICEISSQKANKYAEMVKYYFEGIGQENIVGTGWGVYNAVTGYYCNVKNDGGEKRMDSLLYGGARKIMSDALGKAIKLAS